MRNGSQNRKVYERNKWFVIAMLSMVFLSEKLRYLICSSRERLGKRENVGGMVRLLWCIIAPRGSGNVKDKK